MADAATQKRPRLRVRELLRSSGGDDLPPGQRVVSDFPRFSRRPWQRLPVVPVDPEVRIVGAVARTAGVAIVELRTLPREERIADLNCVTTWCVRRLRWSGVPFRIFYEEVVVARCCPAADVGWLRLVGLDGGSAIVALEDALADEVLLADCLDGEPLTLAHRAPMRFVSPAQYAYKSVKHLIRIELSVEQPESFGGDHPRGRIALEERHPRHPASHVRWPSRLVAPTIAFLAEKSAPRSGP
jgi:DMSO/TMAO reductase YedYZ molybdopterin-dependent catalytic subunit